MRIIDPLNFMGDGGWFGKNPNQKAKLPKVTNPSVGDPDSTMGAAQQMAASGNAASNKLLSRANTTNSMLGGS